MPKKFPHALLRPSDLLGVFMARNEFNAPVIAAQCQRPDPVACVERRSSSEQPEAEVCVYCPVASWLAAMVVSDPLMSESLNAESPISAQWFEPNVLERIGEGLASSEKPAVELLAA